MDIDEKPIVTGKINIYNDDFGTLTGHLGDVTYLDKKDYVLLKKMNGFNTFGQIASASDSEIEEVLLVYNKFKSPKKLELLSEWNQVGWCEKCHVHVAGEKCSICNNKIKKISFSPPCDPFIGFEEERFFVINKLKDKFDITLPHNELFLINNIYEKNNFIWEVEHAGQIILKITFKSFNEEEWIYDLMVEPASIRSRILFNDETLGKMASANRDRQELLYKKSKAFIQECLNYYNSKPLIYFSGGKESLVMLSLFEQLKIKANVITVATGVDFPEDLEFSRRIGDKIKENPCFDYFFYAGQGQDVIDTLNMKKILSAKDPWCRENFKRKLKNKATEDIYQGENFIACEGSRWYENDYRRRHTKVNFINDYPNQVWIHPIAEWAGLDVWLYIFNNKIPVNPMYHKGFQRTTCWLCPIVNPFHIYCSKKYYPDLWEKIDKCKLESFEDDNSSDLPY